MDSLGERGIELRPAAPDDADLIRRILSLASSWGEPNPSTDLDAVNPAYHEAWGRPDDIGAMAFLGIAFVGGAYARRVGPADGTYGYVDPEYLEVTIGIEADHRGQGLGRLVLEVLKAKVMERGLNGLSLSVELDNEAARSLYDSARFTLVEQRKADLLMQWKSPTAY